MPISHDRIFKEFLDRFLPQFMQAFFPPIAARLDLSHYTVENQELVANFPDSQLRITDFIAEVATRDGTPELILIHIEVESGAWHKLPARMHEYYALLRIQRRKPVLPLALVLQPGAGGLTWQVYEEALFDEQLLRFRYGQVGLRDLTPQPYLTGDNPVAAALATLMNLADDDPALVKLTALQTVAGSDLTDGDKLYLMNVIGTYLPAETLPASGAATMSALREIDRMWLDEAIELGEERGLERGRAEGRVEGREEGREEGLHYSIVTFLVARFGAGGSALAGRIAQINDLTTLQRLVALAATAPSLDAFAQALPEG